jgi:hypothetical protein
MSYVGTDKSNYEEAVDQLHAAYAQSSCNSTDTGQDGEAFEEAMTWLPQPSGDISEPQNFGTSTSEILNVAEETNTDFADTTYASKCVEAEEWKPPQAAPTIANNSSFRSYKRIIMYIVIGLLIRGALKAPSTFFITVWNACVLVAIYMWGRHLLGFTGRDRILRDLDGIADMVYTWFARQYNACLDDLAMRVTRNIYEMCAMTDQQPVGVSPGEQEN